jgi:hypothetical protein
MSRKEILQGLFVKRIVPSVAIFPAISTRTQAKQIFGSGSRGWPLQKGSACRAR